MQCCATDWEQHVSCALRYNRPHPTLATRTWQRGVVAAFLPRNTDLEQLASAVPEGAVWEVERAYVNNKLKGITLYAHPAIKQGQPNVRWEAEKEHATAAAAAAAAMEKQQGPGAGAGKGGPGAAGSVPEGDDRESAMAAVTAALAAL